MSELEPLTTHEGNLVATGIKTVIVASRFNSFIVEKLVGGALDTLVRHGADRASQSLVWVPGSWEIPLAAKRVAETLRPDAIICVGCVIRGGTPHFEYVSAEVSKGISHVSLNTGVIVTMGVLTTENLEQAIERSGSKMGNKGAEATLAAIEMVNLLRGLPKAPTR
jgi:6,7-dimethyl-8-ribityllumazine synthase